MGLMDVLQNKKSMHSITTISQEWFHAKTSSEYNWKTHELLFKQCMSANEQIFWTLGTIGNACGFFILYGNAGIYMCHMHNRRVFCDWNWLWSTMVSQIHHWSSHHLGALFSLEYKDQFWLKQVGMDTIFVSNREMEARYIHSYMQGWARSMDYYLMRRWQLGRIRAFIFDASKGLVFTHDSYYFSRSLWHFITRSKCTTIFEYHQLKFGIRNYVL